MNANRTKLFCRNIVLASAIIFSPLGCGSEESLAPVSGTVTYQGKPLANATVTFIPQGKGSLGVGVTAEDGTFSIQTGGKPGVSPGACAVTVTKMEGGGGGQEALKKMSEEDRQKMMMSGQMQGVMKGTPKASIPAQYGNALTSGLTFDVKLDADNTFPITLQ